MLLRPLQAERERLADARDRLEAWRREHNEERPHGSLGNLTRRAFAEQAQHVVCPRKVA